MTKKQEEELVEEIANDLDNERFLRTNEISIWTRAFLASIQANRSEDAAV